MLNWNLVEKSIRKEIDFLELNILPSPFHQNDPIKCLDCLWRLIAILIVSGDIKAEKINCQKDFIWGDVDASIINQDKEHGADWHNSTIQKVKKYFSHKNFIVDYEPNLYLGRSDLGIKSLNLFIEIGTINIYKLYINLLNIGSNKIILVPQDDVIIEFYGKKYRKLFRKI